MKTFNEIKIIASNYAKNKFGDSTIVYGPLIRTENNNLCLGYLFIDFNDEFRNDYRIKRPTKWLLQKIDDGEIIDCYDCSVRDFSTNEILPFDNIYTNDGASILYDDINYISKSFQKWHIGIKKELSEENEINPIYNVGVLKIDDDIISPKDFILANTEPIFNEMYEMLFSKLGNTIREAFDNYQESLFNSIRKENRKDIIKNYYNYIKYSYPELIEVINSFNNIDGTIDKEFDKNLLSIIESKNMKNKSNFKNMINDIDNKLKEIDKNYVPSKIEEKDIENDSNDKYSINDMISIIDSKLDEIDEEEK